MATTAAKLPDDREHPDRRERRFFFCAASVMALVVFAGFANNLAFGRSSFAVPLIFHLHAAAFFGWMALYLTQNTFVLRARLDLHRQLGQLVVLLIPVMLVLGLQLTVVAFRMGMIPPFYDLREFFFGVIAQIIGFVVLATAALALRRQTNWHRRLMFCATALLTKAGFDRLLPIPLLGPMAWWTGALLTYLFPIAAMLAERRRCGAIHQAWYWGISAMAAVHLAAIIVSHLDLAADVIHQVVAGSPGAQRPLNAFTP